MTCNITHPDPGLPKSLHGQCCCICQYHVRPSWPRHLDKPQCECHYFVDEDGGPSNIFKIDDHGICEAFLRRKE